jgi:hypothetical protein
MKRRIKALSSKKSPNSYAYVDISSEFQRFFAEIVSGVPRLTIDEAQFTLRERDSVEQLDEIIQGLTKLRDEVLATLIKAGQVAYDIHQKTHGGTPWQNLPYAVCVAWGLATRDKSMSQQTTFFLGNGRDTAFIIVHNCHQRNPEMRITCETNETVAPRITAINDDRILLEFKEAKNYRVRIFIPQ